MISDSPHLYRKDGLRSGVEAPLIENALEQASEVEKVGLASILTLGHLAHRTGAGYPYLREIVKRNIDPYSDLVIRRSNGRKMRSISSPDPILMEVQRWILEHIVGRLETHNCSFAYTVGSSIKKCAQRHLGATWMIKTDIRNFFETINEVQIYKVYREAGYRPLPALELARLCTRYADHAGHVSAERFRSSSSYDVIKVYSKPFMGFLPQGAPTSGALANQVAWPLDEQLSQLASEKGMVYTRYADDMTFSANSHFNREVAVSAIREIKSILSLGGFELHQQKTRIVPPGARKIVLGLLVDSERIRLNKSTRARLYYHVRGVEKFGLSGHVAHSRFSSMEGMVRHVQGLLAFASDIEPKWAEELTTRWTVALRRSEWI